MSQAKPGKTDRNPSCIMRPLSRHRLVYKRVIVTEAAVSRTPLCHEDRRGQGRRRSFASPAVGAHWDSKEKNDVVLIHHLMGPVGQESCKGSKHAG